MRQVCLPRAPGDAKRTEPTTTPQGGYSKRAPLPPPCKKRKRESERERGRTHRKHKERKETMQRSHPQAKRSQAHENTQGDPEATEVTTKRNGLGGGASSQACLAARSALSAVPRSPEARSCSLSFHSAAAPASDVIGEDVEFWRCMLGGRCQKGTPRLHVSLPQPRGLLLKMTPQAITMHARACSRTA